MLHVKTMAGKNTYRWAFHVPSWTPTDAEIMLSSACIQSEEKERISRFVFKQDFKSSLIGRLMMRKFVNVSMSIPYSDIIFQRDQKGKPVYNSEKCTHKFDFNISHQGDYVVLAGHVGEAKVGIDVMNIVPPVNKNVPEFFRLMNRQFSAHEWSSIKKFNTVKDQLSSFYRHWCLKESYVKNIGVGITVDLQSISFNVITPRLKVGEFITDTDVNVNGVNLKGWIFEESSLDDNHSVAVAVDLRGEEYHSPTSYTMFDFEQLIDGAVPFGEADEEFTSNFFMKDDKTF
ncbi:L-aminoadipate-semialdehyde dehydrogenase-phosphopantetheinyl transferase [Arctopsyche grandis]|uniref:L-aminoadipate-semialdehyde dehydrogenase-phosphopantetheinyl transferase n=1 Tax=Arctopsyche grandis TaxID=121162 RepID=UPI00406D6E66